MNVTQLRAIHPRFIYKSYEIKKGNIQFNFLLEPNISFSSQLVIPALEPGSNLDFYVFNLGMVEAISYWKLACPKEFIVEAGSLSKQQLAWWHDLFIHGLGEFFYTNNIDFTEPNFLTIISNSPKPFATQDKPPLRIRGGERGSYGDLILVGGGKDSAVTLELLKTVPTKKQVLLLNPTPAALAVSKVAGYENPLIVKRTIDAKLLALNKQGYLNGHTPFSAYLAFLGALVAKMYGFSNVIASNEESASFGNVMFHSLEINHQYSKSCRFEKLFREYVGSPNYFSFLRPLNELEIAGIFSKLIKYHGVFKSCNVGRGTRWCGACAKCAFTYTVLSAFLQPNQMKTIFGSDFFENPELWQYFLELAGLGQHKPFECVGTPEETKQAIALAISHYKTLPRVLVKLKEKLNITVEKSVEFRWNDKHFLPEAYEKLLRN